jgi:hypothetical protein
MLEMSSTVLVELTVRWGVRLQDAIFSRCWHFCQCPSPKRLVDTGNCRVRRSIHLSRAGDCCRRFLPELQLDAVWRKSGPEVRRSSPDLWLFLSRFVAPRWAGGCRNFRIRGSSMKNF